MKKPDFRILENADKRTIDELSEHFRAVDDKHADRIFRTSVEKTCKDIPEYTGDTVSGVELYRKPKWRTALQATAAVLAVAVGVSGTALAVNNIKRSADVVPSTGITAEEIVETTAETKYETEPEAPAHKEYDMSTQEGVYYKMLNSMDYFDRASGELIDATNQMPYFKTVEFETDQNTATSYAHVQSWVCYNTLHLTDDFSEYSELLTYEGDRYDYITYSDGIDLHTFDLTTQKHEYKGFGKGSQSVNTKEDTAEFDIPDEQRHTVDSSGNNHWSYRNDATNIREAHNCLCPQEIVFGFLTDFDNWSITDEQDFCGRECVILSGILEGAYGQKQNVAKFEFIVDKETGVLLKLLGYDENGELSKYLEVKRIRFNEYANKVRTVTYTDDEQMIVSYPVKPEYDVNEYGQTYGASDADEIDDLPDLIRVEGDNGIRGYVYRNELLDSADTPEEAMKIQEQKANGTYVAKSYNVYKSDGRTVIDTFTEDIN